MLSVMRDSKRANAERSEEKAEAEGRPSVSEVSLRRRAPSSRSRRVLPGAPSCFAGIDEF